jgi:thiamine biosynthesis lipoprotein
LVDIIAEILESNEIDTYVIDASGDIRHRGAAQTVGLEDPLDPSRVIGIVELQNASLCASASNRRKWGNGLHHVIDGRTGKPTDDVIASWVIADTTAVADGLATALFFVDSDSLQVFDEFQFVRLHNDGHVEHSHDFVGQLFV